MIQTNDKEKAIVKIIKIICIVSLIIILSLCLYSCNYEKKTRNQMPTIGGFGIAIVLSGSMEPEISINDLVIIKKKDSYKKGEIIVYQKENTLIVHRIVSINKNEIITKGDANTLIDDPIIKSDIKGKIIFSIPFIGKIFNL